ncbi:MAG TPA: hypothetical protein VMF67_10105 [Rhizomicrobium sp.]|nr:hypothetical protein [Rhizomicrobium sp.]
MSSSLELLRATCNDDDDENLDLGWPEGFREDVEPPPPQPGHPEYTHFVLYNERMFPNEERDNTVLARVLAENPYVPWVLYPVRAGNLSIEEDLCTRTKQFRDNGYVTELDSLRFAKYRPARLLPHTRAAWRGFAGAAFMADAMLDAFYACPDLFGNEIFRNAQDTAIAPLVGKRDENDNAIGTNVLASDGGLLVAPREIAPNRVYYPALGYTFGAACERGRTQRFGPWMGHRPNEICARMEMEIRAWSDHLGPNFSMDGLVLWIAQTLGWLRLQATEWELRESRHYVMSATHWSPGEIKKEVAVAELERILKMDHNDPARPNLRRIPDSALRDVSSILAGGIGLSDEEAAHNEDVARLYWSRNVLGGIADWVSHLRRFGRETLEPLLVDRIHELMTGEGHDLDGEHFVKGGIRAAAHAVRSEFPDHVWNEIVRIAREFPNGTEEIQVRYRWNDNPIAPATVERQGGEIAIFGPLLPLNAQSQRKWAERAEIFRNRGSLTI